VAQGRPTGARAARGGDVKTVAFRARLTTDRDGRRRQVVEESWRRLRDGFYDPQLHGVDWPAQRAKALRLAAGVDHDADFADVMNILMRSLNASHLGYYPAGARNAVRQPGSASSSTPRKTATACGSPG